MSNRRTIKNSSMALLLSACVFSQAGFAQPGGGGGERRGPPPEAFEACADKDSGDSCEMTGRGGEELQGSCITPKEKEEKEDTLVCVPEGGPGGDRKSDRSSD